MTDIAVTDSHALIWYARGRVKRLGPHARRIFAAAEKGDAVIYVPAIVVVEIFEAARRGVIELAGGAAIWAGQLFSSGGFFPADLTLDVVLRAESLYAIPERGDRLIAATAAVLEYKLITRDPEIARAAAVPLLW